ncbi:MAG: S-layer homology domain-containing protein, partial [Clostridiales Family XIII bacterium]|nr:S-layer homology domain-containing protein [Clostridiales Family XIII bacterium]MDR1135234.1 S-layer homology domain-containing protein [Clostridiales Family XIII bacterium]
AVKLSFPDADSVAGYAKTASLWAVHNGILRGREDGRFDPRAEASRAEAAAVLHRYAVCIGEDAGV